MSEYTDTPESDFDLRAEPRLSRDSASNVAMPQLRRWMRTHTKRRRSLLDNVRVVLVAGIMASFLTGVTTYWVGVNVEHKRADMSQQFDVIKSALLAHTEQIARSNGSAPVLPCPDLTGNGEAAQTCAVGELEGMVPWRTLGVPREMTINGWGNPLVYKIDRPNAHVCAGRLPRKGGLLLSRVFGGIEPDRTIVNATFVLQSFKPVSSVRDDLTYIDAGVGSMFLELCQISEEMKLASP
jgi:hypothetical protein